MILMFTSTADDGRKGVIHFTNVSSSSSIGKMLFVNKGLINYVNTINN